MEDTAAPASGSDSSTPDSVNYGALGIVPDSGGKPDAADQSPASDGASPSVADTKAMSDVPAADQKPSTTPAAPAVSQLPEKFPFGGREFGSRPEAEQYYKSWEGRLAEADRRSNEYYSYVQEVKRQNDQLLERLHAKQDAEKASEEKSKDTLTDNLNLEELAQTIELAKSQGVDPTLILAQHMARLVDTRMEAREAAIRQELSAPVEAMQSEQLVARATGNLFLSARDYKDERGELQYPELGGNGPDTVNEPFVRALYQSFSDLARSAPELAFGPNGFDYAYLATLRAMPAPANGNGNNVAAPAVAAPARDTASQAPPNVARNAKGQFISGQDAAREAVSSVGTESRVPEQEENVDDGSGKALMKEIMRRAPREVRYGNVGLGFTP